MLIIGWRMTSMRVPGRRVRSPLRSRRLPSAERGCHAQGRRHPRRLVPHEHSGRTVRKPQTRNPEAARPPRVQPASPESRHRVSRAPRMVATFSARDICPISRCTRGLNASPSASAPALATTASSVRQQRTPETMVEHGDLDSSRGGPSRHDQLRILAALRRLAQRRSRCRYGRVVSASGRAWKLLARV